MIDGEVVAFDQEGRPSFNALQNYGLAPAPVAYFVFDVRVLAGQNVMREPLHKRRELLENKVLPKLAEPVRYFAPLDDEGENVGVRGAEAGARGQFEFLEWTGDNHLQHSKFVRLREDRKAQDVVRE